MTSFSRFFCEKDLGTFYVSLIYLQMADKKFQKSSKLFYCKICDYNTSRKSQYERHMATDKHKCFQNADKKVPKVPLDNFECECGKVYKHRQSLYKHKQICKVPKVQQGTTIDQNILFEMLKGNTEFKEMLIEQQKTLMEEHQKTIREMIPKLGSNNNSNNTNILLMLNEKCKDAINMSDFLKTLEITLEHLNSTKDGGLAKGVIYTFLDKIKQLDIHERPIHCSDVKRETLYIKDNDLWAKDKDHAKMKYAINRIAFLQRKSLDIWTKANPGYEASTARSNDEYLKLLKNSMQCLIEKNEEGKVIRNICKDIHIDKEEI